MPGYDEPKPTKTRTQPMLPSMIDVIATSKSHSLLYELIKKAGLVSAIKGADHLTFFAPTNPALRSIASLPKSSIKPTLLSHLLQYSSSPPPNHKDMKSFKSLSGSRIDASRVRKFMKSGIKTRNGIIFSTNTLIINIA